MLSSDSYYQRSKTPENEGLENSQVEENPGFPEKRVSSFDNPEHGYNKKKYPDHLEHPLPNSDSNYNRSGENTVTYPIKSHGGKSKYSRSDENTNSDSIKPHGTFIPSLGLSGNSSSSSIDN